jgi:isopenicillin N synthase-like dioxygenase
VQQVSVVPVVDLDDDGAARQVARACADVGFLAVTGHGVPTAVLDAAWRTATDFFDMPLDQRMQVVMPRPGYPYGYSPLAGETLAASLGDVAPPDVKESLAIGPVDPPTHTFADDDEAFAWSPNLWPAALPELRPAWEVCYREMAALAARLLGVMASALGLPSDYFEPLIHRHTSAMRALRYPGADQLPVVDGHWGASGHTDYGTLTVLLADPHEPGLEVVGADGHWHGVHPPRGALVVNLGDAMARWTNDRWRSTVHRVVRPAHQRQSIAFFHNANWDAMIECLPTCLGEDELPKYPPMAAGPHLMHKFRAAVNSSPE